MTVRDLVLLGLSITALLATVDGFLLRRRVDDLVAEVQRLKREVAPWLS